MTIRIGDRLPAATLTVRSGKQTRETTTEEYFDDGRVVLFAVPGAFTPTCHNNHLPGYLENLDAIKGRGVDKVAVLSVNDQFVMAAWAEATEADGKIDFIADPKADFVCALGLESDASTSRLGLRAIRAAMIVDRGLVTALNVEENRAEVTGSGAAAILELL